MAYHGWIKPHDTPSCLESKDQTANGAYSLVGGQKSWFSRFLPPGLGSHSCDGGTLGGAQFLGAGFATLEAAFPLRRSPPFRFANRVLGFANGNIEYLLGELDGIARALGHEASMP